MVNIRYHHCAYASRASMAQRDNRSDMGCFRIKICWVIKQILLGYRDYYMKRWEYAGVGVLFCFSFFTLKKP